MNINAKPGTKVIFHGEGGWPQQSKDARRLLEVGKTYTVSSIDIGGYFSYVWLEECDVKSFNTTLFGEKLE